MSSNDCIHFFYYIVSVSTLWNLYCARIALTFEKKTTALSWLFVGQACDSWWLVTPRPWPGLRLTLTLARCESTGERWAGPGGPWVLTPGRGARSKTRSGPGAGAGVVWPRPWRETGGREKRNRGHEDTGTRTTDQSQSAKRLERAEDWARDQWWVAAQWLRTRLSTKTQSVTDRIRSVEDSRHTEAPLVRRLVAGSEQWVPGFVCPCLLVTACQAQSVQDMTA